MQPLVSTTDPEVWIAELFAAKAVSSGRVIRRNRAWVDREIGRERFMDEVRSRGFHLLETADQFIVVCHSGRIFMHF